MIASPATPHRRLPLSCRPRLVRKTVWRHRQARMRVECPQVWGMRQPGEEVFDLIQLRDHLPGGEHAGSLTFHMPVNSQVLACLQQRLRAALGPTVSVRVNREPGFDDRTYLLITWFQAPRVPAPVSKKNRSQQSYQP